MIGLEGLAGRRIGPSWMLGRLLARGGMSAVYVGRHAVTQRDVAVKVLDPAMFVDPAARDRFIREVTAPVRIRHPGIVEILDAGTDAELGVHYVVMELLEGHDLRHELSAGPVPVDRTLALVRNMLEPLSAAHRAGVVHRDLKPENVFLCSDSGDRFRMKILDFGIARDLKATSATATATAIGTPYYMSPEQMQSARSVGPAADVWSLGVILHEMLSGAPPFDGDTVPAIFVAIATREPPALPPFVPTYLRAAVTACLQKDPGARPQDAEALLKLIAASKDADPTTGFAETRPMIAPTLPLPRGADVGSPRSAVPRTVRMPRDGHGIEAPSDDAAPSSRPVLALGIVVVALVLAFGVAGASIVWPRGNQPPPPAPRSAPSVSIVPAQVAAPTPSVTGRQPRVSPIQPSPVDPTGVESPALRADDGLERPPPRPSSRASAASIPRTLHQVGDACRVDGDCAGGLVCARDRHCAHSLDDLLAAAATASPPATTAAPDPTAAAAIASIDRRDAPTEATPTRDEVLRAMQSVQNAVEHCSGDEHGTASVRVSVSGSTGRVTSATVTGMFASTSVGSCIASSVRQAVFPTFRNPTFTLEYSYRL